MNVSSRFCRHCKSPARGNPCWYYLDDPNAAKAGFDPPCVCDDYRDEAQQRERARQRFVYSLLLAGIGALAVIVGVLR